MKYAFTSMENHSDILKVEKKNCSLCIEKCTLTRLMCQFKRCVILATVEGVTHPIICHYRDDVIGGASHSTPLTPKTSMVWTDLSVD